MGEEPGHHCFVCLERDGCSSHHHNRFQRSHFLPSFCSLFHGTKKERTVSVPGREHVPLLLQAAAVPTSVSLSQLPLPKAEGFCCQVGLAPLGLCQHGLSHCFPSFPVSHQGLAVTRRAGWPGPDFGIGG